MQPGRLSPRGLGVTVLAGGPPQSSTCHPLTLHSPLLEIPRGPSPFKPALRSSPRSEAWREAEGLDPQRLRLVRARLPGARLVRSGRVWGSSYRYWDAAGAQGRRRKQLVQA